MNVDVQKKDERSIKGPSLLLTGHVAHFRLQRHISGKHEGVVRGKGDVVVKQTRA